MCAVLEISKRTYYKYRNAEDKDYYDYLIIKEIFDDSKGTYWYSRITEGIRIKYGVIFNHKKVQRIMNKYYLKPEYIKRIRPNNYKRIEENVTPNLVKRKDVSGLILHSDQGFQYTSYQYKAICNSNNIQISMSRKGTPIDDSPM